MAANRELMWIVAGRIGTALLGVVAIRLITSLLAPQQYGFYSLLITFVSLCGLFLINPITQHINRMTHSWWADGTFLARLRYFWIYTAFVGTLVAGLAYFWLSRGLNIEYGNLSFLSSLAILVMVFVSTTNSTFIFAMNMLGFRGSSMLWGLFSIVVGLGASVTLTAVVPSGMGWFIGQILGLGVGAAGAWWALRHALGQRFSSPLEKSKA